MADADVDDGFRFDDRPPQAHVVADDCNGRDMVRLEACYGAFSGGVGCGVTAAEAKASHFGNMPATGCSDGSNVVTNAAAWVNSTATLVAHEVVADGGNSGRWDSGEHAELGRELPKDEAGS